MKEANDFRCYRSQENKEEVPGRAGGYSASPPTDPDVSNSLIRFLGA
jgi:hypothetical protein